MHYKKWNNDACNANLMHENVYEMNLIINFELWTSEENDEPNVAA